MGDKIIAIFLAPVGALIGMFALELFYLMIRNFCADMADIIKGVIHDLTYDGGSPERYIKKVCDYTLKVALFLLLCVVTYKLIMKGS